MAHGSPSRRLVRSTECDPTRLLTVTRSDVSDSATPLVGRVGWTYYIWLKHLINFNSLRRVVCATTRSLICVSLITLS